MTRIALDAGTWSELSSLLDAALDLPAAERARWLDTLPAEHQPLRERLSELLSQSAIIETGDFLNTLPKLDVIRGAAEPVLKIEQSGDVVGPYRLLRELGVGGMSAVWLAERTDGMVNRPVALKLPHAAWRRSGLIERMAREREFLAALNHPHIARLYDAGVSADGQPYLAIEYVEGQPIDAYCRDHSLDLHSRLRLILQVARAVAYAHGKLIIHRDLKPANILVTGEGHVRLLDFGIAKLLDEGRTENTQLTELSGRVLTPDYASPEQILGAPLTVASDVYSLGVVLFEVLSGDRPYRLRRDSRGALEDAIIHDEIARPSDRVTDRAMAKALRGDLDTIVLKALKKEPDERYPTVHALVDDLERFLTRRPVLAQADSTWYRMTRFVARHKVAFGAATAILVAVLAGAALAVWQARVAVAQKERAEQVKQFIAAIFSDADPYAGRGGEPLSAVGLLMQAKDRVEHLSEQTPELKLELLNLLTGSLLRLEQVDAAADSAGQAVRLAQAGIANDDPLSLQARLNMIDVYRARGDIEHMRVELDAIAPLVGKAAPPNARLRSQVFMQQAHLEIDAGNYEAAERAAAESLSIAQRAFGERDPLTVTAAALLAETYEYGTHPPAEVLERAAASMRLVEAAYADRPNHPRVIDMRHIYGRALASAGDVTAGVAEIERAIAGATQTFGAGSDSVAYMRSNVARYQRLLGELSKALDNATQSLDVLAKTTQPDSYNYAGGLTARGVTLVAARRGAEAFDDLSRSYASMLKTFGPTHEETLIAQYNRAVAMAYLGRETEAAEELDRVMEAYREHYPDSQWRPLYSVAIVARLRGRYEDAIAALELSLTQISPGPLAERARMPVLAEIGLDRLELADTDRALASLQQALASYEKLQTQVTPQRADVWTGLGRALARQGQLAVALPFFEKADRFWREFAPESPWAGEAAAWLAQCYTALGRGRDAAQATARARPLLMRSPIPRQRLVLDAHGW